MKQKKEKIVPIQKAKRIRKKRRRNNILMIPTTSGVISSLEALADSGYYISNTPEDIAEELLAQKLRELAENGWFD